MTSADPIRELRVLHSYFEFLARENETLANEPGASLRTAGKATAYSFAANEVKRVLDKLEKENNGNSRFEV